MNWGWLPWRHAPLSATANSSASEPAHTRPGGFELEDVYSTVLIHIHHLDKLIREDTAAGRRWTDGSGQIVDRDFGVLTNILEDFRWIKQQFVAGVIRSGSLSAEQLREIRTKIEQLHAETDREEALLRAVAVVVVSPDDRVLLVKHGPASSQPAGAYGLPAGKIADDESDEEAAVRKLAEKTGLIVSADDLVQLDSAFKSATTHLTVFACTRYRGQIRPCSTTAPKWADPSEIGAFRNLLPDLPAIVASALDMLGR